MAADKTQFSNDHYNTLELWSGINIGTRWQALAFVPYRINKQVSDDGTLTKNGLGDISLLVNYNLLHSRRHNGSGNIEQQLWIGGGIKLPTGKNEADLSSAGANPGDVNWQTGTGSTDLLLNAAYDISINKVGLNTSVNYKINNHNKSAFHYGDRFTANTFAYYRARALGIGLAPNLGLLYENSAANTLDKAKVVETGGNILLGSAGLEVSFNKLAMGTNLQLPVKQDFAEGQTRSRIRGLVHVTVDL